MPTEGKCVIHWFRRDLRISDNAALRSASKSGLPVVPVYVASDWKVNHLWTGPNRQEFLCECLGSLATGLKSIGGKLIVRRGDQVDQLRDLIHETGAAAVYLNADADPFGKSVEQRLLRMCRELNVGCHIHHDVSLHAPDEVLTLPGEPYKVFTPYSRNWLQRVKPLPVPEPSDLATPRGIPSLELPSIGDWGLGPTDVRLLQAGEKAADDRLTCFLRGRANGYSAKRDFPAESGTSRLSQDLRFGLVSIRTVYEKTAEARENCGPEDRAGFDTFIKELAWREFYFAILHHFPEVLEKDFNPDWRGLWWAEPDEKFDAWKEGRTGFPIVDAGMRELLATGFMHNRVRMITAMFLTKDLHIDWRHGESWFMRNLIDGEIASNNGGWQWSAGTGADAAPYFRIQNPWTQASRYDPKGSYIKKWVPELGDCDPKRFFTPPGPGERIAPDYPKPIVDHAKERDRTLEIFKRHRSKMR
jgi:deoxyribodipyrimidine photo-lyase